MSLQDYLRVLREQWLVVLLTVLLGLAGSAGLFYAKPSEFTAKLTMYVSAQGGDTTQAAFQGAQLSEDRVTSYTELVTSARVVQDVINQLGLQSTPDELAKKITASSSLNSVIINVGATDSSPEQAALIANAVGLSMTTLVAELERPIQVGGAPAVALRVVQPAVVPDKPSSTSLPVTLIFGFTAGLAIGAGAALARNSLDSTVKSTEAIRNVTGAPILGTIAFDPQVPKQPLTVHEEPQSPRSEAFRQLRTNLQFIDVDRPKKIIVITSAMPSEGKSTTLVNLAIALASAGTRILVVEADLRRPKLCDLLGLERTVGLTNILSGRVRVEQGIQSWGGGAFDVMASGPLPPNPSELLASRQMSSLLGSLRERYDLILLDCPPLLPVTDAATVAPVTDGVILVCRFKETTTGQLTSAVDALNSVSARILGTVFTMVPSSGPSAYARYNSYYRTEQERGHENAQLPITAAVPKIHTTAAASLPTQSPIPRYQTSESRAKG